MLSYLSYAGLFMMAAGGFVVILLLFRKFAPKVTTSTAKTAVDHTDLVTNLQNVIMGLDPTKDSAKIEYLLKEVAPVLVDPRSGGSNVK